jgi:TolA-binding protein
MQLGSKVWRALVLAGTMCVAAPFVSAESLADLRVSIERLQAEFQAFRSDMQSTGPGQTLAGDSDPLSRLNALQRELQRLTGHAEELQFRVSKMHADANNRLGDLRFRVCDLDPACDPSSLGPTPVLDGGNPSDDPAGEAGTNDPQLAVGERTDFTAAMTALEAQQFSLAIDRFRTFQESYPGSPFEQEVLLGRGQALEGAGDVREAARFYLAAYSGYPDGRLAGQSLIYLGQALARLGKVLEGCVMLSEVGVRYPGTPAQAAADLAFQNMACS